ncbi:MAG TPA: ferredoxin-type protein NapG [Campylobacterales bacterium]|nr:ferredoxin-type protein NapG [Campylobacterales bacterium]
MTNSNNNRRKFMATTLQSVGLTALGGLLWSGYSDEVKASPLVLRPPSALPENDFLKACIKCGLCAEACVNRDSNKNRDGSKRDGTLQMAKGGDHKLIGTPFFIPRETPCYMCDDIPCVPVCPSGALDMKSLLDEKEELDINKAKMGLAVVHKESCIAFWGIQCDACYRACPIQGEAITIEHQMNERTGKHAYLLPIVHSDICTGCGLCEKACVTEKPAIFVLPRKYSTGKAGNHYVKGWDEKDQQRVKDAKEIHTKDERSEKEASDYLNMGVEY